MDAIAPEVQHRFRKVGREHAFEALKDGVHASLYNACLLTLPSGRAGRGIGVALIIH